MHLHERVAPDALAGSDIVVFAVKPQQMREAAQALAASIAAVPVVLSIAAGIRTGDLARWLGGYRRIVRAMPNTPALIGRGISGAYADPAVDETHREKAEQVLRAAGEVVWCASEDALDAVTGLSGSGPAYVFYLLEALERAGVDQGLDPATARQLAYATFAGAVALAQHSGEEPATLRANVTSKGGTTERGLAVLSARAVDEALRAAVAAATARAKALGDEFGAG
jgi:pyrroline-5-carboxylate reductase